MTLEFIDDQAIAHLDHQHFAYAKHPIIDQERSYFALQVDQAGASFDNIQVFGAGRHPEQKNNWEIIDGRKGQFPFPKSVREEHDILKRNLHARFHMEDSVYRELVDQVELLDQEKKTRYPEVFSSNKEVKKKLQELRKQLRQHDSEYKETLFATFRAQRAIEQYLLDQVPELKDLPNAEKQAALENTRLKYSKDPDFLDLIQLSVEAQTKLENKYPQLFITDQEISQKKELARKAVRENTEYKKLISARNSAHLASLDYLYKKDSRLLNLKKILDEK